MDWSIIMQIGGYLLGMGIIYGTLKTRIDNIDKTFDAIEKQMDSLEERHTSAIDGIRVEVRGINDTLNQLVGKIDMFFKLYCKDGKVNE